MNQQTYKHILVGFDGSTPSKNAVKKAISLAEDINAKVTVAYILDKQNIDLILISGYNNAIDEAQKSAEQEFEKLFNEIEVPENVKVSQKIRLGSPKQLMATVLPEELNIDLIFCGATGTNAIERFILGSVAYHVINHSKVDVTIVR